MGGKEGRVVGNMYKGHLDKDKGGRIESWRWGRVGLGKVVLGKWR